VTFRDERVRDVILADLDPQRQRTLHLAMARRLVAVTGLEAAAAEQFLPVADDLDDPGERQRVAELLRRAAARAGLIGDHALVNGLLTAAVQLMDPGEGAEPADGRRTAELIEVRTARHAALYSMGALDEADAEYAAILRLPATAVARAAASAVQVRSLTHRNRFAAAIELGLACLRELGVAAPAPDRLSTELDGLFDAFRSWLDRDDDQPSGAQPSPTVLATIGLVDATMPAALFAGDLQTHGWLSLRALGLWDVYGPESGLSGAACSVGLAAVALRGDYTAGCRAVRRILARSRACGCDASIGNVRFHVAVLSSWFQPIEDTVAAGRRARAELIAQGDVANAGYSYHLTVAGLLDCAPTLDTWLAELQEGLDFLRRAASAQSLQWLDSYRWLADVLTGRSSASGDDALPSDTFAENPAAVLHGHLNRALAAAVLGQGDELARHTAALMPLLAKAPAFYGTALARVLRGLALAGEARAATGPERAAPLAELAEVTGWLADRTVDAPDNFLHLLRLLEAEHAWALGDFRAAVVAFDAARREVHRRQRPLHRALIIERAARFHLEHGLNGSAADLLAEARRGYADWGATAKVEQLSWAYPVLHRDDLHQDDLHRDDPPQDEPHQDDLNRDDVSAAELPASDLTAAGVPGSDLTAEPAAAGVAASEPSTDLSAGTVDLFGILAASRALSSQTQVDGLHAQVAQVLGSMTGATDVHLLLWDQERQDWRLPAADEDGGSRPVGGPEQGGTLPFSVLRYVARTGETLVVADATRDERFAHDPYFAGLDRCSLLALPIFGRGRLQGLLMLQSRLIRGAFTAERLDGIRLIAGQLAVSLDNAQLYAESRRIAEEQATLRRLATLVARGATPDDVFASVAQEVGRLFRAQLSAVVRFEPDGQVTVMGDHGVTASGLSSHDRARADALTTSVRATGRPTRWDAADPPPTTAPEPGAPEPGEPEVCSMAASPILVEGQVWGSMTVGSQQDPLPADIEHRLTDFTELVATAIANADSRAQLAASRARIIAAADGTRRRIERDLHDGAQQRLISLALQVRAAQSQVPPELTELNASLDRAVADASEALDELRETARGIHPAILKDGGLAAALRTLARRSSVPVDLELESRERLPEPVEVSAYYVVAEALTNAAKHARASGVTVTVQRRDADGALRLTIDDDGVGGADFDRGTGLLGLRDRVEALGGRIGLKSPRGVGTTLTVDLPLPGRPGPMIDGAS
jgi:signal transduction histidine kinase